MTVLGTAQRSRRQEGSVSASEVTRDRISYKPRIEVRPKVLRNSIPEDKEIQTVSFRYKRRFRQECIYVYR